MLRFIKVNGKWIDTLLALKNDHIVYLVIDGMVINADTDEYIGKLEGERDV